MITDGNKYQKPETTCIRRYVQQKRVLDEAERIPYIWLICCRIEIPVVS